MYTAGFIGFDPVCIAAVKEFEDAFNKTLRPLRGGITTFEITQDKVSLLGEYADWLGFDIGTKNPNPLIAQMKGRDLGIAAAVLYNTLVKNAVMRKNHKAGLFRMHESQLYPRQRRNGIRPSGEGLDFF